MKIKYLLQAALVCSLLSNPAFALFDDKFEAEVGKEKMEDIVKAINTKEEGGEGRADALIEKYQRELKKGGGENA